MIPETHEQWFSVKRIAMLDSSAILDHNKSSLYTEGIHLEQHGELIFSIRQPWRRGEERRRKKRKKRGKVRQNYRKECRLKHLWKLRWRLPWKPLKVHTT